MNFRRKRRAISYIMEVVMMTLVITALATVVLTWGLSMVSSSRAAMTGAVNARMNRLQEAIVIEDVQMLDSSHLRVWIRSTGSTQVLIDQIYVNNAQTTVVATCPPGTSAPAPPTTCLGPTKLSLPVQAVGAVDVRTDLVGITVTSGNSYAVLATSSRGTQFQGSFTV